MSESLSGSGKGRTCRLGSGNLHTVISGEPYSPHASHKLPGGCSTLSRADGECWTSFKVQRAESLLSTKPMDVWLTEKGVHSTHTGTHSHCTEPKEVFSPKKREICFFMCVWVLHLGSVILEEGLHFTDGRADVGRGLSTEGFFLITWPGFSACRRCGMWKTVCPTMCSWLENKTKQEINQIQS